MKQFVVYNMKYFTVYQLFGTLNSLLLFLSLFLLFYSIKCTCIFPLETFPTLPFAIFKVLTFVSDSLKINMKTIWKFILQKQNATKAHEGYGIGCVLQYC